MQNFSQNRIFWEYIFGIVLVFLIFIASPFAGAVDADKEAETKSGLHEIQEALERYFVDHGTYPDFLLGGDKEGWENWHSAWDGVNTVDMAGGLKARNEYVNDPLIDKEYLSSYPSNPFVDDGSSVILRTCVEGESGEGHGDPRFGFRGTSMGMGLDDMNYFKGAIHRGPFVWSEIETRRTLDRGEWMNVPEGFKDNEYKMYYLFGGTRSQYFKEEVGIPTYWPGNFFYKAAADYVLPSRHCWTASIPNTNGVGGAKLRYIIGCYGSSGVEGLDVIRLTDSSPDAYRVGWRTPPPFDANAFECGYSDFTGSFGSPGGLPEVFGGGDEHTGPWFYYNEGGRAGGDFIYGAPDGVPDGVILVLTDGGQTFGEVGNE